MPSETLEAPGIAKRSFISISVSLLSSFFLTLIVVSLIAPESSGMFNISALGIGLFAAIIEILFVAFPSSLVVAIAAPKVVHDISYAVAASLSIAASVTLLWVVALASSSALPVGPIAGCFLIGTISNYLSLVIIKNSCTRVKDEGLSILD